jgi:integrase/recombinase XerD
LFTNFGDKIEKGQAKEQQHRRQRVLPIDRDTLVLLRDYIESGGPVEKNGKQLLFGINRHRAWQIVKECAERAGLPKLINPETGKVFGIRPDFNRVTGTLKSLRTLTPLTPSSGHSFDRTK